MLAVLSKSAVKASACPSAAARCIGVCSYKGKVSNFHYRHISSGWQGLMGYNFNRSFTDLPTKISFFSEKKLFLKPITEPGPTSVAARLCARVAIPHRRVLQSPRGIIIIEMGRHFNVEVGSHSIIEVGHHFIVEVGRHFIVVVGRQSVIEVGYYFILEVGRHISKLHLRVFA